MTKGLDVCSCYSGELEFFQNIYTSVEYNHSSVITSVGDVDRTIAQAVLFESLPWYISDTQHQN